MIKNMNSKMTANCQLPTTEPKKQKQKQKQISKQLEQKLNHREDYHPGGENGGKSRGNKKHKWQLQNSEGEVQNSMGNGEAKELICAIHGHELR